LNACLIWSGFAVAVAVVVALVVVDWPALRKTASKALPQQSETVGSGISMSADQQTSDDADQQTSDDATSLSNKLGPNQLVPGSDALKHPALKKRPKPQ